MKKIALVLFSMFLVTMMFAQEVKSVGLTDKDVKNYAKNFNAITKELEKMNDDDFAKFDSILEKYGISGPNRFQKFDMITKCSEIVVYDYTMASDPETASIMKAMGMDPVAEARKLVNQKDLEVVNANAELLAELME